VRIWGNRIHNAVHNGISFQPQNGGPWYIIRNQIVLNKEAAFKFRTTDRFVLLHNTIVNWSTLPRQRPARCRDSASLYRVRIVVSFLSAPGDTVAYRSALRTISSIEKPSSLTWTRIVCGPDCAK
jgi:hypothetical protein